MIRRLCGFQSSKFSISWRDPELQQQLRRSSSSVTSFANRLLLAPGSIIKNKNPQQTRKKKEIMTDSLWEKKNKKQQQKPNIIKNHQASKHLTRSHLLWFLHNLNFLKLSLFLNNMFLSQKAHRCLLWIDQFYFGPNRYMKSGDATTLLSYVVLSVAILAFNKPQEQQCKPAKSSCLRVSIPSHSQVFQTQIQQI